jgi:Flp pilus assembly protein TadG
MRTGSITRLLRSTTGAVAPTVALSLFALIGAGGLAFDYARLAAMDTELQQAADQAALAAATQLDRADGAQARARTAIQAADNANRLAANLTRFANHPGEGGMDVEIASINFCKAFDDSEPDTTTACTPATGDSDSQYVIVTTSVRRADYAFTPIVAAFSGTSEASAVAGVESSICNVAPLLVCVADDSFPTEADIGRGVRLKPLDGISGNYGLLDFGSGTPAVTAALLGHGLDGCQSTDDNQTEPGTKTPVTDAINTRMDVYATNNPNVWSNKTGPLCDTSTGTGCPAANTSKDMVVTLTTTKKNVSAPPAAPACPADPKAAGAVFNAPAAPVKGFSRDNCHYSDTCAASGIAMNFGDGNWDRATYFNDHHPGMLSAAATAAGKSSVATTGPTSLTRYDVYEWELANKATLLQPKSFVTTVSSANKNGTFDYTVTNQCTYPQPVFGSSSYPVEKDRRILPVVAANCDDLKGKGSAFEDYKILRVFDIFLTEPSANRSYPGPTSEKEIYGEVVGPAETVAGASGFQYYSRNKPYLVR